MGFENPVVGGTALRIPAIQSPNYDPGVAGWIIKIDGSAEFNNLTIRGEFSGTNFIINSSGIFLYSSAPATGNLIGSWAAMAGTDDFSNAYQAGLTVGLTATSYLLLNPDAANTFNTGQLEAVVQSFTDDVNQMMPSMLGSVVFNAGAANAQMSAVYHTPIPSGKNGYALVLSADADDASVASGFSIGTVTTDGISMNYVPKLTVDASGNVVPNSVVTYASQSATTTTQTFTTTGTHSFTVPAGVTTMKVECWGAGGGGQGGSGAGGGGGEYAMEPSLAVTAGNSYTYVVGAGGAGGVGGAGGPGSNGGNSTFAGNSVTVTAHGGSGSTSATTSGGTGSTNTTHHNGGGSHANTTGTSTGGAGGGSSAGTAAAGVSGSSNSGTSGGAGGVAPSGGGNGGAGGNGTGTSGTAGVAGSTPGGGGGTGGAGSSSNSAGGAGARGQVRVTYTVPATSVVAASMSASQYTDSQGNTILQGLNGINFSGGAWTTYTPTWSNVSGTAPVLGNGTLTGRYALFGKMLILHINFNAGSTTTFGSAGVNWTFSIPSGFTIVGSNRFGTVICTPNGTGGKRAMGDLGVVNSTSVTGDIYTPNCDATASTTGFLDPATPSTWNTSGSLRIHGAVEVA